MFIKLTTGELINLEQCTEILPQCEKSIRFKKLATDEALENYQIILNRVEFDTIISQVLFETTDHIHFDKVWKSLEMCISSGTKLMDMGRIIQGA